MAPGSSDPATALSASIADTERSLLGAIAEVRAAATSGNEEDLARIGGLLSRMVPLYRRLQQVVQQSEEVVSGAQRRLDKALWSRQGWLYQRHQLLADVPVLQSYSRKNWNLELRAGSDDSTNSQDTQSEVHSGMLRRLAAELALRKEYCERIEALQKQLATKERELRGKRNALKKIPEHLRRVRGQVVDPLYATVGLSSETLLPSASERTALHTLPAPLYAVYACACSARSTTSSSSSSASTANGVVDGVEVLDTPAVGISITVCDGVRLRVFATTTNADPVTDAEAKSDTRDGDGDAEVAVVLTADLIAAGDKSEEGLVVPLGTLLHQLFPGDDGAQLTAGARTVVTVDDRCAGVPGRPYVWAQWLGGHRLFRMTTATADTDPKVREDVLRHTFHRVIGRLRARISAHRRLAAVLQGRSTTPVTVAPLVAPDLYAPHATLNSVGLAPVQAGPKLWSWPAYPDTLQKRFRLRCSWDRRLEVHADLLLTPEFPMRPLRWSLTTASHGMPGVSKDDVAAAVADLETVLNTTLPQSDHSAGVDATNNALARLVYGVDIIVTVLDPSAATGFLPWPQTRVGPDRRLPLQYDAETQSFSH